MAESKRYAEIVISGDSSKAVNALQSVGRAGGGMGRAVKAGAAVAAVGVAAIAGAALFSINAASDFQDDMREVFTLLPGITETAMGAMSDQVKDFSNQFGVLPNEVVPALYQSISAGVPQDNVFAFLEIAQKAAKGGVTDLTTAVDGISSVVNAYGTDVLSAAEASDLMFTAVRLGKTNFEELSASLFNVAPTAAAMGVGFEDVTASIAALTAQGVPTTVATTQMRAALVELGKEGSTAFDAFLAASGQTFPEFIAAGGDLGGAVQALSGHADSTGTSLLNMFGSVEGGQAFTALAADADGFTQILGEMNNSAGATDAAFATMNTGLSASLDRIKARFTTTAITVGEFLLPKVEAFTTWALDTAVPAVQDLIDRFTPLAVAIKDDVVGAFEALVDFAEDNIIPIFEAVSEAFAEDGLAGVFDLVKRKAAEFGPALAAVGAVVVVAFGAWAFSAAAAAAATIAAAAPLIAVAAAAAALAAGFVWAYQNVDWFRDSVDAVVGFIGRNWRPTFETIRDITVTVFEKIAEVVEPLVGIFVDTVELLKALFTGDFSRVWDEFKSIISGAIETAVAYFREFPGTMLTAFLDAAGALLTGLSTWFTETAAPKVGEWLGTWTTAVVDFVAGIPGAIADVASSAWNGLKDAFIGAVNWIIEKWNGIGFTLPTFEIDIPWDGQDAYVFGGQTFNVPQIPLLHGGGVFLPPGGRREGLALLSRGEQVVTPGNAVLGGGGVSGDVVFQVDGQTFARISRKSLIESLRRDGPIQGLAVSG